MAMQHFDYQKKEVERKQRLMSDLEMRIDAVTGVKGISKNDSKALLKKYGSLKEIVMMVDQNLEELSKIKFLGKQKVQRLKQAFEG